MRNDFMKKITSGTATIIESGTFITYDENPVEITFGKYRETNEPLKIIFDFVNDKEIDHTDLKSEAIEEKILKLTLINFKNDLGSGTLKPLQIGMYQDKKLSIGFRVHTMGRGLQRTFHYTFYQHE